MLRTKPSHVVLVLVVASICTCASLVPAPTALAQRGVVIDQKPAQTTNSTSADFAFHTTPNSWGAVFFCSVDGVRMPSGNCRSPVHYDGLAEGDHTFLIEVWPGLPNPPPEAAASYEWTIDLTPETSIDSHPPKLANRESVSTPFTFSSSNADVSFECRLGNADFAACASPVSYGNLSDGTYTFEVRAVDRAGNVDDSPAQYSWTVDVLAPQTKIDSGPPAQTSSHAATFTFSSPDTDVERFQCQLDGGLFADCVSPWTVSDVPVGPHSVQVRAVDRAGNPDLAPPSWTWRVRLAAPLNVSPPTISGVAQQGSELQCAPGTWTGSVTSFSYAWYHDGSSAALSTSDRYTPTVSDVAQRLVCEVIAANGDASATARSAATAAVVPRAPVNLGRPAISGIARVGTELVCNRGTWDGAVSGFSYAWYRVGAPAAPLWTSDRYTPGPGDVGHALVCHVTASNAGGSASAASLPTDPVRVPVPANETLPTISGTPKVGSKLTCHSGTWTSSPSTYRFVWTRRPNVGEPGWPPLKDHSVPAGSNGQAESEYQAVDADAQHVVRCEVTASNAGGDSQTVRVGVQIASAGAGAQTVNVRGVTLRAPRRVYMRSGRRVSFTLRSKTAGVIYLVLRPKRAPHVVRGRARLSMRHGGSYRVGMTLPKRTGAGRYTLSVRFKPRTGRAVTRTAPIVVVR